MPRLRRSPPDSLSFDSSEDLSNFLGEAAVNAEFLYERFSNFADHVSGLTSIEGDRAAVIMSRSKDHVFRLIEKCDKYCPHIDRLPYVKPHFVLPGFAVITCFECSADWMEAVVPDDDVCDLCGGVVPGHIFNEINIQFGPAMISANLGDCCIDLFR